MAKEVCLRPPYPVFTHFTPYCTLPPPYKNTHKHPQTHINTHHSSFSQTYTLEEREAEKGERIILTLHPRANDIVNENSQF